MKSRSMALLALVAVLGSCSTTPKKRNLPGLTTKVVNQQYYYCESCDKPTTLSTEKYQPLEPDQEVSAVKRPVAPEVRTTTKATTLRQKSQHQPHNNHSKHCIKWN